jgi:aspartyl-tRNA(Asn)/glutamyl-tRNA(Gln) amidotransferase subunit B
MPASDYIPSIGLEIHVHLKTRSKMFCRCATGYGDPPNANTCPVCLGLPGALPVLNERAIEMTVLTGLLLGARVPETCKWDRKNYFYADMPKNYQISQYDLPLVVGGAIPVYEACLPKEARPEGRPDGTGVVRSIDLTRIHLEEDAGKSTHFGQTSGLDFNRAGTPLMEIVTEPVIPDADEAAAVLASLRQVLVFAGVSDADMEKGQMRCDVNISVRRKGAGKLGAKIELKNLNSVSAVRRAINFEIERQCGELDRGIAQRQETRRWDDERGESFDMRGKEHAHDYRYFPDPDLLPVRTPEIVGRIREALPEMPHAKRARFVSDLGLTPYDAEIITSHRDIACFFEGAAAGAARPKAVANWIINDLLGRLNDAGMDITETRFPPRDLRELLGLIEGGKVTGAQAKELFAAMFAGEGPPAVLARAKGFEQLGDASELERFVDEAISANAGIAERLKAGETKLLNVLVGKVMKLSAGKASPKTAGELVMKRLT